MINVVVLTGSCYISKFDDPEKNVCKFQIKHSPYKDADKEYLSVEAWDNEYRKLASIVRDRFATPGAPVEIRGILRARKYEDKEGNQRVSTYVQAESVNRPPKDWSAENQAAGDDHDASDESSLLPF
jgi:single-stranded DNA-binding protein